MKRLKMKFGGYIYVENYQSKHNEEENRSKIYDEDMQYIDYIDTECISKKEYNKMIKEFKNQSFEEFIENFSLVYDYSVNLIYLLDSVYDSDYMGYNDYDSCKQTIDELNHDYLSLKEKELCSKYSVNRIGDYYFYMGEY